MTDENALIAQKAAVLATKHMLECINPESESSISSLKGSDNLNPPYVYSISGQRLYKKERNPHGIYITSDKKALYGKAVNK